MKIQKPIALVTGVGILGAIAWLIFVLITKPTTDFEDIDAAKGIMEEFVEHPVLGKIAKDYAFGGVFPRELIKFDDCDSGIAMWFCADALNPSDKKLFLALERTIHPEDDILKRPTQTAQLIPISFSKYKNSPNILEYLENDISFEPKRDTLHLLTSRHQPIEETNAKIQFYRAMLDGERISDQLKQVTNYAFFQNNKEKKSDKHGWLRRLHDQTHTTYIRYYFGCNIKNDTNRVRVLLFSVDSLGRNILYQKDSAGNFIKDKYGKKASALILQRSIPPRSR